MRRFIAFFFLVHFIPATALKIDRVILATDLNQNYIQYWPVAAHLWQDIMGIRPTLVFIAPKDALIDESLGDVIRFEPIPNIPTYRQAQIIRLVLPALFPDDVCITADIDLIPISKDFLLKSVEDIPDDRLVTYIPINHRRKEIQMCYVAAKGSTFSEIFDVRTIDDIRDFLTRHLDKPSWFTKIYAADQRILYHYAVEKWSAYRERCFTLKYDTRIHRMEIFPSKFIPAQERIGRFMHDIESLKTRDYIDAWPGRPYDHPVHNAEANRIITLIYEKHGLEVPQEFRQGPLKKGLRA